MKPNHSFKFILMAFFSFVCSLIFVRFLFTNNVAFFFIIWNLFLAWIPYFISSYFQKIYSAKSWKQILVLLTWLLFFPNALYIVTDLIHLNDKTNVPKWFDAVIIFSACVLGLMMAFISLLRVEHFFEHRFGNKKVNLFIFAILFIASFGVYLGRFLRWNSWDVIGNPTALFLSIVDRIFYPFHHLQTWGITFIFTVLFYLLYLSIKKMPGYISQANL
jgi:uncharacterized membrane protein